MNSGIYRIENTIDGKAYVGSAVDFDARWRKHRKDLRRGNHHSYKLQAAWDQAGETAFVFRRLLVCAPSDLMLFEQRALDATKVARHGYNVSPTASSIRGIKRRPFTAEHRAKLSAARKRRPPEKRTAEQRAKMSASRRKLIASGFVVPAINFTPEVRAKMSASLTGKRLSAVTIAKKSAAMRIYMAAPEARERCAVLARLVWARRRAGAAHD